MSEKLRDNQELSCIDGFITPAKRFENIETKLDKIYDRVRFLEIKIVALSMGISGAMFLIAHFLLKP